MSLLQNSKGFQNFVIAVILLITAITFTLQGPPVLWQLWVHIRSLRCGFAVIFECVVNGFLNQPGEQSRTKCASVKMLSSALILVEQGAGLVRVEPYIYTLCVYTYVCMYVYMCIYIFR